MTDSSRRLVGAHSARRFERRQSGIAYAVKRLVDVVGAVLLLVLTSPVLALCAAAVTLETGRPVFYRGVRLGRSQHPFQIWKLRSMIADADDQLHRDGIAAAMSGELTEADGCDVVFKVPEDPRVTRIGHFLRCTSLDELPQLFNVLRGEMSLVGPRPEVEYALEYYQPEHHRRFEVLPGITGLWQVSGRSSVSPQRMLELDVRYVEEWSLGLDFRILLRTIPVALSRSGA